ncbi:MAG: glycosyltransferase [Flavisolibacter sp.]
MNPKQDPYILWLPSWYPNQEEPYNGDFIQRHAKAAALYDEITVIFFTQYGAGKASRGKIVATGQGRLKEIIVYVPFAPLGIPFLDRIRYNARYYAFARRYLKKHFAEAGLPELVHVHVPVKAGNLARWIKRKTGIAYLVSEQASTYLKEAPYNFYQRHILYKKQVKDIFAGAEAVTNVSQAVGEILRLLFPVKRLSVIHNTVDTNLFKKGEGNKGVFTFIHVSTLSEQKNILGILRSFQNLAGIRRDWRLILVGPYNREIEEFIREQQLEDCIRLTGEVSYEAVAAQMQHADVFVLFSRHENFPCVVVEALCSGLPVVSSDVAGVREAVNEANGILVASGDETALLQGLIRIREDFSRYDREMISAEAVRKYGYQPIGLQFHQLYEEMKRKLHG